MLRFVRNWLGSGSAVSGPSSSTAETSRGVLAAAGNASPEALALGAQLARMLAAPKTNRDPEAIAKIILAGPGAEINMCFGNDFSHQRAVAEDPAAARWQKATFGEHHHGYIHFTVTGPNREVVVRERLFSRLGAFGELLGSNGFDSVNRAEDEKVNLGPSGIAAASVPTTNPQVMAVVLSAATEGEDPMCRATRATIKFFLPADLATALVDDIKSRPDGIGAFKSIMQNLRKELVAGKAFIPREIR